MRWSIGARNADLPPGRCASRATARKTMRGLEPVGSMNRFAQLLDRLAFEHGRNAKLRLMTEYFRTTPDPERGITLAALTGALSFPHAKPGIIRALIAERTDPVLFELSYDYVGDLSETVALLWPRPPAGRGTQTAPPLCDVVARLGTLGKVELPAQLARWLDALDETGRWALLKLVTGGLRIGVSARLAKTAVAALGDKDPDEIELIWPGLSPPYAELFAWVEGSGEKPIGRDPAPFRPVMLAHAVEEEDLAPLDPRAYIGEWKWDGIRVQAAAGRGEDGARVARLYSRTGEDTRSPGETARRTPDRSLAAHRILHVAGAGRRAEKSGGGRGRPRRRGRRRRDAQAVRGRLRAGPAAGAVVEMEARPGAGRRGADVRPARQRQTFLVLFRLHLRRLAQRPRGRGAGAGRQGVFRLQRRGAAADRSLRAA